MERHGAPADGVAYLLETLPTLTGEAHGGCDDTVLVFLLPRTGGYVARSDFLQQRMVACDMVTRVCEFVCPGQRLDGAMTKAYSSGSLVDHLRLAAAALQLRPQAGDSPHVLLQAVGPELSKRLSFPWLVESPVSRKRVVLVEGRPSILVGERLFASAQSLGVDLVVLDRPDHWIADASYSHLRQLFLPIDMTVDDGLPARIAAAVSGQGGGAVDGITTFSDRYFIAVAHAAELLGLPTSPPAALATCVDKYATRRLQADDDDGSVLYATDAADLRAQLALHGDNRLRYPVVVKPCTGWNSEGVAKAANRAELCSAADRIAALHTGAASAMLVEPYIDGPEFDANFVLWQGDVLFFELTDDTPCTADATAAEADDAVPASFHEVALVYPSALCQAERDLLRTSLHQMLLRLGLASGVFHVEARVRNSSMEYSVDDGMLDLRYKRPTASNAATTTGTTPSTEMTIGTRAPAEPVAAASPSIYLHEINARPPGFIAVWATAHTYGVDYYALQLLLAAADAPRARALAQPFAGGAQHWCHLLLIPAPRGGGVFASPDMCAALRERCPTLMAHVTHCACLFGAGDVVPDPAAGQLSWLAYFLVRSTRSRRHALQVSDAIRQQVRYVIKPLSRSGEGKSDVELVL